MDIPTSSFAVVAVVVMAVPGFVFAGVRRWAGGDRAEDRDVGLSIARGVVFAVALAAVYAILAGPFILGAISVSAKDSISIRDPRLAGLLVLVLFVLVPLGISLLMHGSSIEWTAINHGPKFVRLPRSKFGYSAVPDAWDFAAIRKQHSWIRVTRTDGSRVAGWFTGGSFISSYPEPPSIYVDQQCTVADDGELGHLLPGQGFWIQIQATDVVEWITPEPKEEDAK